MIVDHVFEQDNLFSITLSLKIFETCLELWIISLARHLLGNSSSETFQNAIGFCLDFCLLRQKRCVLFEFYLQKNLFWLYLYVQGYPRFKAKRQLRAFYSHTKFLFVQETIVHKQNLDHVFLVKQPESDSMVEIKLAKQIAFPFFEASSVLADQLYSELCILGNVLDHQAIDDWSLINKHLNCSRVQLSSLCQLDKVAASHFNLKS